jgi:hypothetical protein
VHAVKVVVDSATLNPPPPSLAKLKLKTQLKNADEELWLYTPPPFCALPLVKTNPSNVYKCVTPYSKFLMYMPRWVSWPSTVQRAA